MRGIFWTGAGLCIYHLLLLLLLLLLLSLLLLLLLRLILTLSSLLIKSCIKNISFSQFFFPFSFVCLFVICDVRHIPHQPILFFQYIFHNRCTTTISFNSMFLCSSSTLPYTHLFSLLKIICLRVMFLFSSFFFLPVFFSPLCLCFCLSLSLTLSLL